MTKSADTLELIAGAGMLLAGLAGHWLITPISHPSANGLQYAAAWAQLIGGVAYAAWATREARALRAAGQVGPSWGQYELLAGVAGFMAAWAGHWLITPVSHPNANGLQYLAAWVQVIGGLAYCVWATRKARALKAALPSN